MDEVNSNAETTIEQYFAYALGQETVSCFFAFQSMQLDSINMQEPEVNLLVFRQPELSSTEWEYIGVGVMRISLGFSRSFSSPRSSHFKSASMILSPRRHTESLE